LVLAGVFALVAKFYLNRKRHPAVSFDPRAEEALSTFRYGPFDCLSRMDISVWACCCPAIRLADNVSTIGLLRSFWLAFTIFLGFELIVGFEQTEPEEEISLGMDGTQVVLLDGPQDLVLWTILAVINASFRQELRHKFKMTQGGTTFFQDCLLHCCCGCCAITQEARQIEEAMLCGHPAIVKPANQAEEAGEAAADQAGQPGPPS